MIRAVEGPLIVAPESWTLVFDRAASTWWASWLACGCYKHVRAYAYVPYLHVWVFFDPHITGVDIIVAADGEPAAALIGKWTVNADLIAMRRQVSRETRLPLFGFCVPIIKRLLGIRCGALRPTALRAWCLRNGGVPFEAPNGRPGIQTAAA